MADATTLESIDKEHTIAELEVGDSLQDKFEQSNSSKVISLDTESANMETDCPLVPSIDKQVEMPLSEEKSNEPTFDMSEVEEKSSELINYEAIAVPAADEKSCETTIGEKNEMSIAKDNTAEHVVDESVEMPISKESDELTTEEPIAVPVCNEISTQPTVHEPIESPVVEEKPSEPIMSKQIEMSVLEDKTTEPISNLDKEIIENSSKEKEKLINSSIDQLMDSATEDISVAENKIIEPVANLDDAIIENSLKEKDELSSSSTDQLMDSATDGGVQSVNLNTLIESSANEGPEEHENMEVHSSDHIKNSETSMVTLSHVDNSEKNTTNPSGQSSATNELPIKDNETHSEHLDLNTVSIETIPIGTVDKTAEMSLSEHSENVTSDLIHKDPENSPRTTDMETIHSEVSNKTTETNNIGEVSSEVNSEVIPNIAIKLEFQDSIENHNFEDCNVMSTEDSPFIKTEVPEDVEMTECELTNMKLAKQINGRIERVEGNVMEEADEERTVTMLDVLQEQQELEEDADAVLGASDDKNCTYSEGYIKRQALYACLTCCSEARNNPTKRAGVCLACSLSCHENHELIELYTKRNFRCDCGNPNFDSHPCNFTKDKSEFNADNKYNQNFSGLYCICHRPYPDPESTVDDEMIQCIVCEDWLHASHLESAVPDNDQYSEMICKMCMDKNDFLNDYTCYAVNIKEKEFADAANGNVNIHCNESSQSDHSMTLENADSEILEDKTVVEEPAAESDKQATLHEIPRIGLDCEKATDSQTCTLTISEVISNAETSESLNSLETNKIAESTANMETEDSQEENKDTIAESDSTGHIINEETTTALKLPEDVNLLNKENIKLIDSQHIIGSEIYKYVTETDNVNESSQTETNEKPLESLIEAGNSEILKESSKTSEITESESSISPTSTFENDTIKDASNEINATKSPHQLTAPEISQESSIESNNIPEEISSNETSEKLIENIAANEPLKEINDTNKIMNETNSSLPSTIAFKEASEERSEIHEIKNKTEIIVQSNETLEEHHKKTIPNDNEITNKSDFSVDSTDFSDETKTNEKTEETEIIEPRGREISEERAKESNENSETTNEIFPKIPMETDIPKETNETSSVENIVEQTKFKESENLMADADVEMISSEIMMEGEATSVDSRVQENSGMEIDKFDNSERNEKNKEISSEDVTMNSEEELTEKVEEIVNEANISPEGITNKRKLSTDTENLIDTSNKKSKINEDCEVEDCKRPKPSAKRAKGSTFWPCNWRQKLCSCSNCITMYRSKDVLFLLDLEDTVTAYEDLGKARNQGKTSQYEKGLEALSSLDRTQQINALTEYNRMKNELLDYLISFKNRQEVVKVEDIEKFFSDIKPKKKPDGVYFCR